MSFRGSVVTSVAAGPGMTAETTPSGQVTVSVGPSVAKVQENINTVANSGAAQAIPDVTTATLNKITLTANCTLTFPAAAAGKNFIIALTQDATGSRLVTWPGNIKWSGGTAPTLTTTPGKTDVISFICFDGANWIGIVASENF